MCHSVCEAFSLNTSRTPKLRVHKVARKGMHKTGTRHDKIRWDIRYVRLCILQLCSGCIENVHR